MDIIHLQLLELLLLTGAPFVFALVATAVAWRSIPHRALYAVLAVLSFWGLSTLTYPFLLDQLNPTASGPATYPSAQFNVIAANAAIGVLLGFPLMWWLRNALRAA